MRVSRVADLHARANARCLCPCVGLVQKCGWVGVLHKQPSKAAERLFAARRLESCKETVDWKCCKNSCSVASRVSSFGLHQIDLDSKSCLELCALDCSCPLRKRVETGSNRMPPSSRKCSKVGPSQITAYNYPDSSKRCIRTMRKLSRVQPNKDKPGHPELRSLKASLKISQARTGHFLTIDAMRGFTALHRRKKP